jgi:hypothetical protein
MLTVVGCNQFVLSMIALTALDTLPPVDSNLRQFLWPVHPENASVDVPFIAGPNLQYPSNPFLLILHRGSLALDAGVICNEDEVVGKVFAPVH